MAHRQVYPVFAKILAFRKNILFSRDNILQLRASGDPEDSKVADVIEKVLDSPEEPYRRDGKSQQVVLLDPDAGFVLDHPVKHDGRSAWLRGQRYTSSKALKTRPATTDELRAAGG